MYPQPGSVLLRFSSFYEHPFIRSIAKRAKWSISTNKKMPINLQLLARTGRIKGATPPYSQCTTDLETLCALIPNAANHAYNLDCLQDGFVVVDIEPKCPVDLRQKLLSLPYIYGERSLSKKGYHLILPLPENFYQYENAAKKVALQDPDRNFEILLNHWVTFTRDMIPSSHPSLDWERFYAEMAGANNQPPVSIRDLDISSVPFSIREQCLFDDLFVRGHSFTKTPADYQNDQSRFEYACMQHFRNKLQWLLSWEIYSDLSVDPGRQAWIIYSAAKNVLPYRKKHDEKRKGMPYLLYMARAAVQGR